MDSHNSRIVPVPEICFFYLFPYQTRPMTDYSLYNIYFSVVLRRRQFRILWQYDSIVSLYQIYDVVCIASKYERVLLSDNFGGLHWRDNCTFTNDLDKIYAF